MTQGIFTMAQQLQGQVRKTWGNSMSPPYVEYLVVAGGGGGGATIAGGGGAGGLLQGLTPITAGQSITVTVGTGGTGTATTGQAGAGVAGQGGNSVFGNITAVGGGNGTYNGGPSNDVYAQGGSGGGAGRTGWNAGLGISGQGNNGGTASGGDANAAGGGGAGSQGVNASTVSGNGGSGIASSISGTLTAYAGGGGGGIRCGIGSPIASVVGVGGTGGGGCGSLSAVATAGTANTGGGGGGGGYNGTYWGGGNGGSGIVIISYPDTYNAPTAVTGTYTASTSGSGSLYASTTDQYLLYSTNAAFGMGTGDFTVEAWIYWSGTNSSAANNWLDLRATISASAIVIGVDLTGKPYFYDGPANATFTSASAISSNTWYHFALARSGTTWKFFQSGVQVATTTSASNLGSSQPCYFMQGVNGSNVQFQGYVSNLRIVKGTAVYTTTFTPSATPLTAISGTSLLLNTVSGARFADSSTNSFVATVTGTPTWNQLSPFATGLGYKNRVYKWTGSGTVTF